MSKDSEHQPLASSTTNTELYSQEVAPATDSAFSHESRDVTGAGARADKTSWFFLQKRYVIALMAFLGFGENISPVWTHDFSGRLMLSSCMIHPGFHFT